MLQAIACIVRDVEILFVTPELAPYSVRPLAPEIAETAASLPKALRGLGHRVTVVSPLYKGIDPSARSLARRLSTLSVETCGKTYTCTIYDGRTTGGIDLIFLGNAELFGERNGPDADPETLLRSAIVLSTAAAQLASEREPQVEVLHAHGVACALALSLAKLKRPELVCALSCYDAHHIGAFDATRIPELGLPPNVSEQLASNRSSLLACGVVSADAVMTTAPATASAMLDDMTSPLAALLRSKSNRFAGIVNGVDASVWNPLIDSQLSARFDATNLAGKARCKGSFQYMLGLGVNPDIPLVVAIGELSEARGGDLIAAIAADCLRNEMQLCVLGSEGDAAVRLQELSAEYPERLAIRTGYDDKERHLAVGGSDFLLLPARAERSVEIALAALRYGSLPIVCPVGGLADVIVDADAKLETGTGFVADKPEPAEVLAAVQRALGAYAKRNALGALRKRAMQKDVSWERSARRYEHLYKQVVKQSAPAA